LERPLWLRRIHALAELPRIQGFRFLQTLKQRTHPFGVRCPLLHHATTADGDTRDAILHLETLCWLRRIYALAEFLRVQ